MDESVRMLRIFVNGDERETRALVGGLVSVRVEVNGIEAEIVIHEDGSLGANITSEDVCYGAVSGPLEPAPLV